MKKSPLSIRDAFPDERAAIRELTIAAYAEYAAVMAPAAWAELERAVSNALDTTEPAERIVADQDGQLVGSVMLYAASADAYKGAIAQVSCPELRLLAVAPEARGHGVGSALVDECVHRAQRSGATELGLHTSASMRVAIAMYERMGFTRAPALDFQPPGAEYITAYRLNLQSTSPR